MNRYLSLSEFAVQVGVKPSTLSGYKLPEPDVWIGSIRGWSQDNIDAWQAARPGKGAGAGRKRKKRVYTMHIERDGVFWIIRVDGVPGGTQTKKHADIEAVARDFISVVEDVESESFEIERTGDTKHALGKRSF